jgi:ferredoxin
MVTKMKAFVEKDTCIGCGICEEECPYVFHMEADGKAVAISDAIPEAQHESAESAKGSCPVDAITLE